MSEAGLRQARVRWQALDDFVVRFRSLRKQEPEWAAEERAPVERRRPGFDEAAVIDEAVAEEEPSGGQRGFG
jgi:hypothetical protein